MRQDTCTTPLTSPEPEHDLIDIRKYWKEWKGIISP